MKIRKVKGNWEVRGYKPKYYNVGILHRVKYDITWHIFLGSNLLKQIWKYFKWRITDP